MSKVVVSSPDQLPHTITHTPDSAGFVPPAEFFGFM